MHTLYSLHQDSYDAIGRPTAGPDETSCLLVSRTSASSRSSTRRRAALRRRTCKLGERDDVDGAGRLQATAPQKLRISARRRPDITWPPPGRSKTQHAYFAGLAFAIVRSDLHNTYMHPKLLREFWADLTCTDTHVPCLGRWPKRGRCGRLKHRLPRTRRFLALHRD